MSQWQEVRRQARAWHATAAAAAGGAVSAAALLEAAERLTGVARVAVPAGDALLDGAQALLDVDAGIVVFDGDAEPWRVSFYQAHEYAHLWLDGGRSACSGSDMDAAAAEDGVPVGAGRIAGYGPHERREREANAFALEFLLPARALRRWYLGEGLDVPAIAARCGLPMAFVLQQLARAVLAPAFDDDSAGLPAPGGSSASAGFDRTTQGALDPSQKAAAHAPHGPLLLEAGPGTGKTRTLVARILFLLEQGIAPSSILALTFSTRAAEEMRARVAAAAGAGAAAQLWTGTFHAFGLELLRKFGTHLGLPAQPAVLDPVDALFVLEQALPVLRLDHYQNLYDPALHLRDILAAISRAKDELVGPAEYAALARAMAATAATPAEVEAAARAGEVGRAYGVYQHLLHQKGLLDFGDLIARAVALLREYPAVRALVQATYTHVLVDEYQDVNRASALLLRELAGAGAGLWVVGDARQAIYRFRGAAPVNMRLFPEDFPGATVLALQRNYRSRPAIVRALGALAPRMRATESLPFVPWDADRPEAEGGVLLEIAEDGQAEIEGVARAVERRRAAGVPYRDQAVLCRSHATLARMARGLEQAGVPVLYLGDLFERPEVRDLLSLLSLACEGDGHALVRVALFAEYDLPLDDVRALLDEADARDVPFPRALTLAADAPGVSQRGRAGFALLAAHLDGLWYGTSAWSMLAHYLFLRSGYLHRLASAESPDGRQQRIAIYQLLQLAHARRDTQPDAGGMDPKRSFLRYVRRLEIAGEDKGFAQSPEQDAGIDAVRLLTIHAAKGLEWHTVYLPVLGQRYFPAPAQWQPCPPPTGMLTASQGATHGEGHNSRGGSPLQLKARYQPSNSRRGTGPPTQGGVPALQLKAGYRPRSGEVVRRSRPEKSSGEVASAIPGGVQDEREMEEENLFFVAVSRARDALCLSRARRYGRQASKPTTLLGLLSGVLGESFDGEVTWPARPSLPAEDPSAPRHTSPGETPPSFDVELLDLYLRCPRRFYYEHVLGLSARHDDAAYAGFHRCVHAVLAWLHDERAQGRAVDAAAASARLAELWRADGPRDPFHEGLYREVAEATVARALAQPARSYRRGGGPPWEVELSRGRVLVQPDDLEVAGDGGEQSVVVRRLRTGRASTGERDKDVYALYHAAAARAYPHARRQVQAVDLCTDGVTDIALSTASVATRLKRYDEAIAGIEREQFAARPDDRRCPRCPHYFICPAAGP